MSYECTFICSPELDSTKVEEIVSKVSNLIETAGGTIKNLQQLGKKKLAYNIKKFREGNYVYVEFDANGSVVLSLEKFFKVNDDVIRFLTVKVEPKKKVVKKAKAVEAKKEAAAEVAAPVEEKKEEDKKEEVENAESSISDTTTK